MFKELLKRRKSVRKYQKKTIEKEKINYLLECAMLAPSSRSRRPWEFIVVEDSDLLKRLANCREHSSQFLAEAPLGIVVTADPNKCDVWIEDCSIVAIIIQLAAESIGLGSCWIQIRERFNGDSIKAEEYIKKNLNIPDQFNVECMIAIGYKEDQIDNDNDVRLNLLEKLHYHNY